MNNTIGMTRERGWNRIAGPLTRLWLGWDVEILPFKPPFVFVFWPLEKYDTYVAWCS